MSHFKILLFSAFIFSLQGCTTDDKDDESNQSIIGAWQLTEASISAGGASEWNRVDDGETYQFFEDGSFTSTSFDDCSKGEFILENQILSLNYTCPNFETGLENEAGFITYEVKFENDGFLLIPKSVVCVEGCAYKFTRTKS